MARIVAGFGVPHVPFLPAQAVREGPTSETAGLFAQVRGALMSVPIDVIVEFSTDHLNTFFFDNLPTFALGVTDRFSGPNDETDAVPVSTIRSNPALASHLRRVAIDEGFDLSLVQDFTVDHSFAVPLHFLTPEMNIPVVPVFINGHIDPLPSARRCYALGQSIGRAVASFGDDLRVAVVGSGSFSLEVLGPRMHEGLPFGVPDPAWDARIQALMADGAVETLLEETTPAQLRKGGNVAGELFNWLAMLGALQGRRPERLLSQPQYGHAYGWWTGEER